MSRSSSAILILILGACSLPVAEAAAQASSPAGECAALPARYDTLQVNGDPLYVEPIALEADGNGSHLLLGRHVFRFAMNAEGAVVGVDERSWVGAVIRGPGVTGLLPAPDTTKEYSAFRAIAAGPGRWHVVFAELRSGDSAVLDTAAALWYGEVENSGWRTLRRIPIPDVVVTPAHASSLHQRGDTLTWIVPTEAVRMGLLVVQWTGTDWQSQHVLTNALMAEPLGLPLDDLHLATIQADSTLQTDGQTLLRRSRRRGWEVVEVIRPSRVEPVYRIEARQVGDWSTLTWVTELPGEGQVVRTLLQHPRGGRDRLLTVSNHTAGRPSLAPVHAADSWLAWATSHASAHGTPEIHIHILGGDGVETIGTFPDLFVTPQRTASSRRGLAVAGGVYVDRRYVATLVVDVQVRCSTAGA